MLLLLLFGIIDIGRAVFYYDTLNHAAREGARTAVQRLDTAADQRRRPGDGDARSWSARR